MSTLRGSRRLAPSSRPDLLIVDPCGCDAPPSPADPAMKAPDSQWWAEPQSFIFPTLNRQQHHLQGGAAGMITVSVRPVCCGTAQTTRPMLFRHWWKTSSHHRYRHQTDAPATWKNADGTGLQPKLRDVLHHGRRATPRSPRAFGLAGHCPKGLSWYPRFSPFPARPTTAVTIFWAHRCDKPWSDRLPVRRRASACSAKDR